MSDVLLATNPSWPYTDTPPTGGPYWYQVEVIDGASSQVLSNMSPIAGFTAPQPNLKAFLVATLRANAAFSAAFGDSSATPRIFADADFSSSALPYVVYTEPEDKPLRVFGGYAIGQGSVEFGVFDKEKEQARAKMLLVRQALNAISVPVNVGEGTLIYLKSSDDSGRDLKNLAPTPESDPNAPPATPQVLEFGRSLVFNYKIVRTDP